MAGASVCTKHGGGAPQVRAKGRRHLAEEKAARILEAEGVVAMTNPVPVLQQLAAEALALVGIFREMVAELDHFGYEGAGVGEQLRAEVGLYERALDRAQKFALDLVKIGLDEMVATINERQVAVVLAWVTAAMAEVGLTPDQQDRLRRALGQQARHYRELPAVSA